MRLPLPEGDVNEVGDMIWPDAGDASPESRAANTSVTLAMVLNPPAKPGVDLQARANTDGNSMSHDYIVVANEQASSVHLWRQQKYIVSHCNRRRAARAVMSQGVP